MGLFDRLRDAAGNVTSSVMNNMTSAVMENVTLVAKRTPALEMPVLPDDPHLEVVGEEGQLDEIQQLLKDLKAPMTPFGADLAWVSGVLVPEPWNKLDPQSVAVVVKGCHVGYLMPQDAAVYSPLVMKLMISGRKLLPVETSISLRRGGGVGQARITVIVPHPRRVPQG